MEASWCSWLPGCAKKALLICLHLCQGYRQLWRTIWEATVGADFWVEAYFRSQQQRGACQHLQFNSRVQFGPR